MHITGVTLHPESFPAKEFYPFNLQALRKTREIPLRKHVTFFAGENGSGKSTLLRAIARACAIHIWDEPERATCAVNQYEDAFQRFISIEWSSGPVPGSFFAAELFRHFARNVDEWATMNPGLLKYYGSEPLLAKSHGECHMSYFSNRFCIKGMYLLDEPENALSPSKQIEFLKLLRKAASKGISQFIIATHSPILLAYPDADIYSFDRAPLQIIDYESTEHYRVYRHFMNNREEYFNE